MPETRAQFHVGQIVQHKMFGYRGVVVDVDPEFQGDDEWYEVMARSRPPKHRPWYHVLVHDADYNTYVAERNLEPDDSPEPVRHILVDTYFSALRDGEYVVRRRMN